MLPLDAQGARRPHLESREKMVDEQAFRDYFSQTWNSIS